MISDERIMGFVEGEGCFCIGIQKNIDRKPRKTGRKSKIKRLALFRVNPSFRVAISEADNKILNEIKETLGFGQIYTQNRSAKNFLNQNVSYYYAQGHQEAKKVRDFFSKQRFYTRKKKDFELWCKCLEIIESGRHLEYGGLLEICELRDQMNHKKNKSKRSTEEIKRILQEKPEHILAHSHQKQQTLIHNKVVADADWLLPRRGNYKKGPYSKQNGSEPLLMSK